MADEKPLTFLEQVTVRVEAICPESAKIKPESKKVFIEDAVYDSEKAFAGKDEALRIRAAAYLAAHYCAVNLYQQSQSYPEENFGEIESGTTGTSGSGAVKVNAYKDKRQEFFEKRSASQGNALVKWTGKVSADMIPLTGTSYGQEYLSLMKKYLPLEPFYVGNDPNESLGRDSADFPGERYRRW